MTTNFGYDIGNKMKCGKHGLTLMMEMFNEHKWRRKCSLMEQI